MSKSHFGWIGGLMLGLCSAVALGGPTTRPASPELAARVHHLVDQLNDPDPQARQTAEDAIYLLPTEAFPLIEAAGQRKNLPPAVATALPRIIDHERPWIAPRRRREKIRREAFDWRRDTALKAYQSVGHKNPKWDEMAITGIKAFFSPAWSWLGRPALAPLKKAIDAGCDDPLVMYLAARTMAHWTDEHAAIISDLSRRSAEAMEHGKYPPYFKSRALHWWVRHDISEMRHVRNAKSPPVDHKISKQLLEYNAWAKWYWSKALENKDFPESLGRRLARDLMDQASWWKGGRKPAFDWMDNILKKTYPDSVWRLVFEGRFYINYAWDARGGGYADTVTKQGWKLFQQRLVQAETLLKKAWKMDPDDPTAPTLMLTVELGQGCGRARMEKWFERAMQADPNDRDACDGKLLYLQPKWYGNAANTLVFGNKCLETRNWAGQIPFVLIDARLDLSQYYKDKKKLQAYFAQPDVWHDFKAVYESFLRIRPHAIMIRSQWAYYCCWCGHWKEARRQFEILGDKAVPSAFHGQKMMEQYQAEAKRKTAAASQPASAPTTRQAGRPGAI